MRSYLTGSILVLAFTLSCSAQQDTELEMARTRCNDVLTTITRGRSAYPSLGVIYDWPTFHQLFDSKNPRVRGLAADTLITLVSWDWPMGPGMKYLDKTNDPRVRSAVLASVLPAAVRDVSAGAPDYVIQSLKKHRDAVAPIFRELMTAPTAPPYLDVILRFTYEHSVPAQMIPDGEGERALVAKRVVHAATIMFDKARTQTVDDYPETTFMNTVTGEPRSPGARDVMLESFRKRDRETAAKVLFAFAEAMPEEFWAELCSFLKATPDVEFRRFVLMDFLSVLLPVKIEESKNPFLEKANPVLEVLQRDWDEEVRLGAQRLLLRVETLEAMPSKGVKPKDSEAPK